MTALQHITTHVADAEARLLEQYKGKPRFQTILDSLSTRVQEVEDAFIDMLTSLTLASGVGTQLDNIGVLVGLVRPTGLSDANYRALLYAKIGENISQGETERVIAVYGLATQATRVHMQDLGTGSVIISGNGTIDPTLVGLLGDFVQNVVGAGVRVDAFGSFDPVKPFAFAGGPLGNAGFGDANDATKGGKLAQFYYLNMPVFALASTEYDTTYAGFGDVRDPVAGGKLSSS